MNDSRFFSVLSRMAALRGRSIAALACGLVYAVVCILGPTSVQGDGAPQASKRTLDFASLGFKFEGASTCASCHGGGSQKAPATREQAIKNAYSVWDGKDKHHDAYKTLTNATSAAIMKALGRTTAATADSTCLECHAVKGVTPELKGTGFSLKEGNSCNSCHGPSEKWLVPHATPGWTQQQRTAMSHEALLTKWGIYDTKPLTARVDLCTSCHLRIGSDLVAAGHPAPNFEAGYFSELEPRHWIPQANFDGAKLWVIGQTICLREAMSQLANRAQEAKPQDQAIASAYQQAAAHLWVLRDAADAFGLDAKAFGDHASKLMDLAPKLSGNAAAIAQEALATAADAETAHQKMESYEAKQADVAKAMAAIAGDTQIATINDASAAKDRSYGAFGENQQGFALYTLSLAYETGTKAAPTLSVQVRKTLLAAYPKKPALAADEYAKALADVKSKLPGQ